MPTAPRIGPAVIMGAPPVEVADAATELAAPAREEATDEAADSADEAADIAEEALEEAADSADEALELAADMAELAPLEMAEAPDEAKEEAAERSEERAEVAPGVLKTVEKPVVTGVPEMVPTRGIVVTADGVAMEPVMVEPVAMAADEAALERMVRAEPPETLAEARRAGWSQRSVTW